MYDRDKLLNKLQESWNQIIEKEETNSPQNEFIIPPKDIKQVPLKKTDSLEEVDTVPTEEPNVEKPSLMHHFISKDGQQTCNNCEFNEDFWSDNNEEQFDGDDMNDPFANEKTPTEPASIGEAKKTTIPQPSPDTPEFDPVAGVDPSKFNRDMYKKELKYAASDPEHNKPGAKPLHTQPDTANPGQKEPIFIPNKQDPSTYGDRAGDRVSQFGMNIKDNPDAYLDSLKNIMLETPTDDKLFGQNAKLQKSGDANTIFFDFTLPAYSGIYYSEKLDDFQMLTTCPAAGECKKFCYARKGNFTQYPANHLPRSQMLSYVINKPKEFVERMIKTINSAAQRQFKKGKTVYFRWHDSGDWFSETYAKMALYIASKTPEVTHYAYTKQVKLIKSLVSSGQVPSNFIFNYSFGGQQDASINRANDKFSYVIKPEEDLIFSLGSFKRTWKELMNAQKEAKEAKSSLNKAKRSNDKGAIIAAKETYNVANKKVDDAIAKIDKECMNDILKSGIEKKLGLPTGSVITYFEMVAKPENPKQNPKWSVLVYPGCGDVSAARKDVSGTLLLIH